MYKETSRYDERYNKGYKAAIDSIAIPVKEWDKALWSDEEWNSKGEEYINKYKEIMEQLPEDSRYLLFELELLQMDQNNISLKLFYKYISTNIKGGACNDK